jgi:hypothetical protein
MTSVPSVGRDQPEPPEAGSAGRPPHADPARLDAEDSSAQAVEAASARATTAVRLFGSPRHALTRRGGGGDRPPGPGPARTDSVDLGMP